MDDELLAPPPDPGTADEQLPAASGDFHFSRGFADSRQAVRIWVDEDTRHLNKVRVSPRWRDRVAGRSLADAFAEAFFVANVRFGESRNLEVPPLEDPPEVDTDLTIDEAVERLTQLESRLAELQARPAEQVRWGDFEGEKVRYVGPRGRVAVTLSLAGLTESVEFDRDWLGSAEASQIDEHVLSAHRAAYDRYVPPAFVPGEHEELASEFVQLQAAFNSLMSKGIE